MPFVSGYLKVGQPGHPDAGLPDPEDPVDPGYGISADRPEQGLPIPPPPPGIWPPPSLSRPIVPIGPDNSLPVQPGTIWPPPGAPARPDQGLPGGQGGNVDNTLPSQVFWMLAYCPSLGWKFLAVDPSLTVGMPLPETPEPKT